MNGRILQGCPIFMETRTDFTTEIVLSQSEISATGEMIPDSARSLVTKADKVEFILLHELAVESRTSNYLRARLFDETFEIVLRGIADAVDGKWQMKPQYWRKLDVWNYQYIPQANRQLAIANASLMYDRLGLDLNDPAWQRLLKRDERGKGVVPGALHALVDGVSQVRLNDMVYPPAQTPAEPLSGFPLPNKDITGSKGKGKESEEQQASVLPRTNYATTPSPRTGGSWRNFVSMQSPSRPPATTAASSFIHTGDYVPDAVLMDHDHTMNQPRADGAEYVPEDEEEMEESSWFDPTMMMPASSSYMEMPETTSYMMPNSSYPMSLNTSYMTPRSDVEVPNTSHICTVPGCESKTSFKRKADLMRHFEQIHQASEQKKQFYCDYSKCDRSQDPFGRIDHFRQHYRDFHGEDLPRKSGESANWYADKKQSVSKRRWRCVKCLNKVTIEDSGFTCDNCNTPCETQRRQIRGYT
jgi:hypothetical protein